MKKMFTHLIVSCFLMTTSVHLVAQEAVLSAGGDASGTGGTISYSAGLTVYETYASSSGQVALGVQHPWEFWILTGIAPDLPLFCSINVYPNPVTSRLAIVTIGDIPSIAAWQIRDPLGRLILTGRITPPQTNIDLSPVTSGFYLISILGDRNTILKTFKITKK